MAWLSKNSKRADIGMKNGVCPLKVYKKWRDVGYFLYLCK